MPIWTTSPSVPPFDVSKKERSTLTLTSHSTDTGAPVGDGLNIGDTHYVTDAAWVIEEIRVWSGNVWNAFSAWASSSGIQATQYLYTWTTLPTGITAWDLAIDSGTGAITHYYNWNTRVPLATPWAEPLYPRFAYTLA
jgi:hypothetical protein